MKHNVIDEEKTHTSSSTGFNNALEEILRVGARKLLAQAIENEVSEYIEINKNERDDRNKRLVIRNGHLPEREIQTGLGPIFLKQARIRDRREGEKFTSALSNFNFRVEGLKLDTCISDRKLPVNTSLFVIRYIGPSSNLDA